MCKIQDFLILSLIYADFISWNVNIIQNLSFI